MNNLSIEEKERIEKALKSLLMAIACFQYFKRLDTDSIDTIETSVYCMNIDVKTIYEIIKSKPENKEIQS